MKKVKQYLYDLFTSIFKTKSLFKFAIYNFVTPLILLLFITGMMALPSIISYNNLKIETITNNVSYIDKVLAYTLDQDIKCSIKDNKLACEENYYYETLYEFQNKNSDTIKYKIYINTNVSGIDFSTGEFGQHKETDNYLVLSETAFVYRYTYHNPKDETVNEYQSYGFYDDLNGVDFSKINAEADTYQDKDGYLLTKSHTILLDGYKAAGREQLFTTVGIDLLMYLMFTLLVALLFKGNYMLNRKKGLKYTQAFKVGIVCSLQSALIALALSLFGFSFINVFGLAIAARVIYIYIKYTGSRKNTTWLNDLYEYSKDERFNING